MVECDMHMLVITDMPATTDFEGLGMPSDRFTILPIHHDLRFPTDSPHIDYQLPNVYVWHEDFGREVHFDLERLSRAIASEIKRSEGYLTASPRALTFSLLDGALWNYLLVRRAEAILKRDGSISSIGLFIRDKDLSRVAHAIFRAFKDQSLAEIDSDLRTFKTIELSSISRIYKYRWVLAAFLFLPRVFKRILNAPYRAYFMSILLNTRKLLRYWYGYVRSFPPAFRLAFRSAFRAVKYVLKNGRRGLLGIGGRKAATSTARPSRRPESALSCIADVIKRCQRNVHQQYRACVKWFRAQIICLTAPILSALSCLADVVKRCRRNLHQQYKACVKWFRAQIAAGRKWRKGQLKGGSDLRRELETITAPILSASKSGADPALVCWLCRDNNYSTALIRVLTEILKTRPVILMIEGSGGNITERLALLTQSAPNKIYTINFDDLYPIARRHGKEIVGRSLDHLKGAIHKDFSLLDQAFLKNFMMNFIADSSRVHIIGVVNELMRQLSTRPMAYGLMASGRSSIFAAFAEWLASKDRPSVDVHIYLVGNHARQIAPPTTYAAVIDDQQERVVTGFWGWSPQRCIRTGYLWRQPSVTVNVARAQTAHTVVLICTQPGDTDMVKHFFLDVVSTLAPLEKATIWLKLHPAETEVILRFYTETLGRLVGKDRVRIFGGRDHLAELLPGADVVVTRTSNAGIEAALMGKPTVRYLAYDKYDMTVERSVAYARTVWTRDELGGCLSELVTCPEARKSQINEQATYLKANPAQAAADGPARLVSFLESEILVSAGDRLSALS